MNYTNPFETAQTGEDIKNWIWFNANAVTKYTSLAKGMNKFFNLDDKKTYMMKMCDGAPIAVEVEEKGKKHEVPCPN